MTETDILDPPTGEQTPPPAAGSNSLPELAARIRAEHEATGDALKSSVEHGIAAGELLIEAKAKVQHGQWLPWLRDNCEMSERTAQLYMRLAKNREPIEIKSAMAFGFEYERGSRASDAEFRRP